MDIVRLELLLHYLCKCPRDNGSVQTHDTLGFPGRARGVIDAYGVVGTNLRIEIVIVTSWNIRNADDRTIDGRRRLGERQQCQAGGLLSDSTL